MAVFAVTTPNNVISARLSVLLLDRQARKNYCRGSATHKCTLWRVPATGVKAASAPRHGSDAPELVRLLSWTEEEFLKYTKGSTIRRIGYECWLRNIAVALGNAPTSEAIVDAPSQFHR